MNKYRWQAIVFVLVAFMLGCNEFIVVGVLSDIAQEFHVSVSLVGYLVTIFATVYAVSTPFITILTNRFSRYKTLMVLMVIFLVGNTLSGLAMNFTVLLLSRVLTAVVAGAIISLIMTFASAIAPREKRANLVSWIFAGFSIASVFGVPIGTAISTAYSWHDAFYLITVISLVTCLLLGWLLPKQVEQVQGSIKNQLVLLADKRIYLGIVLVLFTAATMYAYYTYIRPILTTGLGFSTTSLNWLLFLIGIMNILCNRFSGMLAERNGLRVMPRFYVADIVLLLLLPWGMNSKLIGLGILLILTLIVTILNSPIQIHFLNIAEREYPQSTVLASSLNSIFFNFGISLGSATASGMLGVVGLRYISWSAAVFAAISLVLALVLNRAIAQHRSAQPSQA
ncbi:arabinose efflux permease [Levilactobacillus namurensis DSM 19117]|uniref:Arabinose efflux permease n=1 Tax=Levilactobacillus namurensis DSM 19117 TaxID=1423773 RepID=A0A0R1K558_9LACO|nr:MFS transporter [Levilactobacillus namurensis]KRK75961.1 arabinose efflux permease [Levilactobacillus namurensis DSM 19117]GEO74463.1 chloramphenicol resistance protein [Levilactobacillus namurensis]HJE45913.1 MFS transporter [Levilactobacillus namurensis]